MTFRRSLLKFITGAQQSFPNFATLSTSDGDVRMLDERSTFEIV